MMRAGVAGEGIILRMRNKQDFLIDKNVRSKMILKIFSLSTKRIDLPFAEMGKSQQRFEG